MFAAKMLYVTTGFDYGNAQVLRGIRLRNRAGERRTNQPGTNDNYIKF